MKQSNITVLIIICINLNNQENIVVVLDFSLLNHSLLIDFVVGYKNMKLYQMYVRNAFIKIISNLVNIIINNIMVNTSYNFYFANILFCDYYCVYKTIFSFAIHKIQDKGLKHLFYIKVLMCMYYKNNMISQLGDT